QAGRGRFDIPDDERNGGGGGVLVHSLIGDAGDDGQIIDRIDRDGEADSGEVVGTPAVVDPKGDGGGSIGIADGGKAQGPAGSGADVADDEVGQDRRVAVAGSDREGLKLVGSS